MKMRTEQQSHFEVSATTSMTRLEQNQGATRISESTRKANEVQVAAKVTRLTEAKGCAKYPEPDVEAGHGGPAVRQSQAVPGEQVSDALTGTKQDEER
jgi:hypothetical protein